MQKKNSKQKKRGGGERGRERACLLYGVLYADEETFVFRLNNLEVNSALT